MRLLSSVPVVPPAGKSFPPSLTSRLFWLTQVPQPCPFFPPFCRHRPGRGSHVRNGCWGGMRCSSFSSKHSDLSVVVLCTRSGHAAHHTDRHQGRVNHRQLTDPQSKRPRPASTADNPPTRKRPALRVWPRPAVLSLHCRTGHRGLKSMTEKLRGGRGGRGGGKAGGSASLLNVKHNGISVRSPGIVCRCARVSVHTTHHTERHPGRADRKQLSDPRSKRPGPASAGFSCSEPGCLVAASVPVNLCTVPRRHGRITHQPGVAPHEGFGPDLPCYPSTVARVIEV